MHQKQGGAVARARIVAVVLVTTVLSSGYAAPPSVPPPAFLPPTPDLKFFTVPPQAVGAAPMPRPVTSKPESAPAGPAAFQPPSTSLPSALDLPQLAAPPAKGVADSLSDAEPFGLKSLFDSFHSPKSEGAAKHWYDKLTIRGYTQIRYGDSFTRHLDGIETSLFGDRAIGDRIGTFSVRRARLLVSEEIDEHLYFQFQSDFANNPADGTDTLFAQIRDLFVDIHLDREKVNRFRVGQSKVPWGFEEMQSSGLRIPLDRSDAIDSGNSPNQRDLGVFYYWTPVDKQKLLKHLAEDGLKGTGNYGIFALGVYNGQGGSQVDLNRSLHTVARITWPFQLPSGQAVEVSFQGYTGRFVVHGEEIQPLGVGPAVAPAGTGVSSLRDERLAATFVWYPQPFGFQAEWNVGRGPGLNDSQTAVGVRSLEGGYAMMTYKIDTQAHGIFIPFARYQHYRGGYKSITNAPYGTHDEVDFGCEWQISKSLELVVEYGYLNSLSLHASNESGVRSYQNFEGHLLRCQLQVNY